MPTPPLPPDIKAYNAALSPADKRLCTALAKHISKALSSADGYECKVWHAHPVWFLSSNPIVGYSKLKSGDAPIRLLFWSGQTFDEPSLAPEGSFKAAEARFTSLDDLSEKDLARWLRKSIAIQWDYKNLIKRKGRLERFK
jgi:hypothetical protein